MEQNKQGNIGSFWDGKALRIAFLISWAGIDLIWLTRTLRRI